MNYAIPMLRYASKFIGQPYFWGGQGPYAWDCSGFILEVLKAFGRVGNKDDMTAGGLHRYLLTKGWKQGLQAGSIVFFGEDTTSISHVGIAINQDLYLSAASGDKTTTSIQRATEQNAFVKQRVIRRDLVASLFHPDDIFKDNVIHLKDYMLN